MNILENLKTNIYPIQQLLLTEELNYNMGRLKSLNELNNSLVYNQVMNNLKILEPKKTKHKQIISEVLLWSDIAKAGTKEEREKWQKKGYNLFVHNIGSSEIYKEHTNNYNHIVYVLIKTHGLIGQYLMGEVNLNLNKELYQLIQNQEISKEDLKEILLILNECIIKEVSEEIYHNQEQEIEVIVNKIINGNLEEDIGVVKRFELLNDGILEEDKKSLEEILKNQKINERLINIFSKCQIWYYKAALHSFSIIEQVKILLLISNNVENISEITFEPLMKDIYLDYKDIKRVNIYKTRIIEKYLKDITYEQILLKQIESNINIAYDIKKYNTVLKFNFSFSEVAEKLIEFCEIAYLSDPIYKKSVILLYDLFGFRKDNYDRFYNEIDYLKRMNAGINNKAKILEFMVGKNILDVGPGGGVLMDLILDNYSDKKVYGIDIASNVIEELNNKKLKEKREYSLVQGDALNLEEYFEKGSIDTIIFSSIIHELFSYINYEGRKFNHQTIIKALKSAYSILPVGGRIIIRDGIMTEEKVNRIIEFKNKDDLEILKRYQQDFKGRKIAYQQIAENKVLMDVNDAMEFLYTYTWGEESYPIEVQEQFGYYTPSQYEKVIKNNLKNSHIIFSKSFLQNGYQDFLEKKINFYDEEYNTVSLPNSTYILVVEKQ